jgi:hypothetical protein
MAGLTPEERSELPRKAAARSVKANTGVAPRKPAANPRENGELK